MSPSRRRTAAVTSSFAARTARSTPAAPLTRRVAVHADGVITAPAAEVWDVLVDWPRHGEWMPLTRAEGGAGVGAGVRAWTGVGPLGFVDTMVITAWEPPYRVEVRHTGAVVRGEARFDLLDLPGDRCRVRWSELIDLPFGPLGRAGWIAVGPPARAFMTLALRRLGRLDRLAA